MAFPDEIKNTALYKHLSQNTKLLFYVESLRDITEKLAAETSRIVPAFTDHTILHMDKLWIITYSVLTVEEINKLTHGEAFILACCFYLHDIGMAYAATNEGIAKIKTSPEYLSIISKESKSSTSDLNLEAKAIAFAVRERHSTAAIELATKKVPGTDYYLFEAKSVRDNWANICGKIASSHHLNINQIESNYGSQSTIPLPDNEKGDLAYIACILRIVDYAHINKDRASTIVRAFRPTMNRESLIHWLAQESIQGPIRDGTDLVYNASKPINDVDAWWLYYGMLKGLDSEIRTVRRLFSRIRPNKELFSLMAVRGVDSPEEAVKIIPTDKFLPIEIKLRAGSIERVVKLLAGESLYGKNFMAPVRELIQNARDAVLLKSAVHKNEHAKASLNIPIRLSLKTENGSKTLSISDPGIGMTKNILIDYLTLIASDYWNTQFHTDYPQINKTEFQPAGKYGIGFLSVFMLGDEVIVESNKIGCTRYCLRLHGVGKRGELRITESSPASGTSVKVILNESASKSFDDFDELVKIYAPTIPHHIEVETDNKRTQIPKDWIKDLTPFEFMSWTQRVFNKFKFYRHGLPSIHFSSSYIKDYQDHNHDDSILIQTWPLDWPEYNDNNIRLIASLTGVSLLTLQGLSVRPIETPGFSGVINVDNAILDVSRQKIIDFDVSDIIRKAYSATKNEIINNLGEIFKSGSIMNHYKLLRDCINSYGDDILRDAHFNWISLLKLPGEIELINCKTLFDKLKSSDALFISYGSGPWNAINSWSEQFSDSSKSELGIVLDDVDHIPYLSLDEVKKGKLKDIYKNYYHTTLFKMILDIAADAWNLKVQVFGDQENWFRSSSRLFGYLTRPKK